MTTTAELFALARQSQQTGDLRQAEACCRRVLQIDPGHAEALHLLGGLAFQSGQYPTAADLVRQAIERGLPNAAWHADLGLVYQAQGRMADAAASYQDALRL